MEEITRFTLPTGTEVIKSRDGYEIVFRWGNGAYMDSKLGEMLEERYADE